MIGEFEFPPLGDTGAGPIYHKGRQGEQIWADPTGKYRVTLQEDHAACAFRCHLPDDQSVPCDHETALAFINEVSA